MCISISDERVLLERSVPVGSAGMSACGWNSHRSGSTAALRFWSSSRSARPHATSCEHWSARCWWDGRHLRLWSTGTSLWMTSCGCEWETALLMLKEEINSAGGSVATRETYQNSPSSSTVMPRLPRSVSPTFDHSSELMTSKQGKRRLLTHFSGSARYK